jgi:hypothetical protein
MRLQRSWKSLHDVSTLLVRLWRFYYALFYDFTPNSGHDAACFDKRDEIVELSEFEDPILRSYCVYEDSTTFLLRFVTIGLVFGHALIVVVWRGRGAATICVISIWSNFCSCWWIVSKSIRPFMLEVWKEVKSNIWNQRYMYIIAKIELEAHYKHDMIGTTYRSNIVVQSSSCP